MLMYTSGTTAMPKGCLLPHEALVRPAYAMRDRFLLTDQDRMWDALPLFHLASLLPLHACMLAGTSYIAMRHFEPAAALAQMERERCTTAFPAFETLWLAVINHPDFASTDLSAMRLVLNVGTRERLEQMQAKMPWATQISSYGCTELGGVCAFGHVEDPPDAAREHLRTPVPGHGDPHRRPRDRRDAAAERDRRDHLPRPLDVRRLPPGARADRAGRRRRGLLPHRRPRRARSQTAGSCTAAG